MSASSCLSPPVVVQSLWSTTVKHPTSMASTATAPKWAQRTITLPPQRRGCHLITPKIMKEIGKDLSEFKCGLAHFFLQHTSASLTINENYDSDVRDDTETFLNRIVPEGPSAPWKHTIEDGRKESKSTQQSERMGGAPRVESIDPTGGSSSQSGGSLSESSGSPPYQSSGACHNTNSHGMPRMACRGDRELPCTNLCNMRNHE